MITTVTALTTLEVAKDELDISGSSSDAKLERLIRQASSLISTECGREFGLQQLTETFSRGDGVDYSITRPLILSAAPVARLDAVAASGGMLEPGSYAIEPGSGLLHRVEGGTPRAWGADLPVTVTYLSGFETIPADLEAIALQLIVMGWVARGRDPGIKQESIQGAGSITYFEGAGMVLTEDIRDQLAPWKARV
ncbi:hypothetical protein [Roseomonas sp. USHLN139]|uniref:hypothetical protein n=1 Tax=Roseomonas sp. USHLN139 TaxID=3081298 RepID=UPI003B025907